MTAKSQRWKQNEKFLEELANEFKIKAKRKNRADNYAISDFDVEFIDAPNIKPDAKYRVSGFTTNRLLDETKTKYCKEPGDIPLIFCRGYRDTKLDAKITLPAPYALALISYWNGFCGKLELEEILKGNK